MMPMWLVWTTVVVVGIVLLRALWEGSWERLTWLGLSLLPGLLAMGIPYLEEWVSSLPWGVRTIVSAVCGLSLILSWLGFGVGLLITTFAPIGSSQTSFKRNY
jgi:hypothetical protein